MGYRNRARLTGQPDQKTQRGRSLIPTAMCQFSGTTNHESPRLRSTLRGSASEMGSKSARCAILWRGDSISTPPHAHLRWWVPMATTFMGMRFQTSEIAGTPRGAEPPPNNGEGRRPPDRVRGRLCRPYLNNLLDRALVLGPVRSHVPGKSWKNMLVFAAGRREARDGPSDLLRS